MLTLPQGLSPAQMMSWGWGVLQGKVNDGQITNYGGPAPKGSSHTTGSAVLSKPPAARKQWAWQLLLWCLDRPVQLAAWDPSSRSSRKLFSNALWKNRAGNGAQWSKTLPLKLSTAKRKHKIQKKAASILSYKMKNKEIPVTILQTVLIYLIFT